MPQEKLIDTTLGELEIKALASSKCPMCRSVREEFSRFNEFGRKIGSLKACIYENCTAKLRIEALAPIWIKAEKAV